jgi:glycosyltransferase involved in cell wall biosynthesis
VHDDVLVIIPALDEAERIGPVLKAVGRRFPSILVVDDCSTDGTREVARSHGARVVRHPINRGLGGALGTGFAVARKEDFRYVATCDADGQHRMEDLDRVVAPVLAGDADLVIGSRFLEREGEMPPVKSIGNTFLTALTNLLFGSRVSDSQSGLRALNRKALDVMDIYYDDYAVSSEIVKLAAQNGLAIKEVPIATLYDDYNIERGTKVWHGTAIASEMVDAFVRERKR